MPRRTFIESSDSIQLSVYNYSSKSSANRQVLLSHATGFHGRCFDPVVNFLKNKFDCTSFDYRGFGDSKLNSDWQVEWQGYCDDALAVANSLHDHGRIIAVGHSMGGAALIMAALIAPELFKALIIYEPIIFPATFRQASKDLHVPSPLVEGARRRRTTFASREEALANYSSKPPMDVFKNESLRAYVEYGFNDIEDTKTKQRSVVLKCLPEHEARTYETGAAHQTWDQLHLLQVPTWVVSGAVAPNQPSAWSELIAKEIQNAKFIQWSDVGHFGPMQQPDRLASLISEVDKLASDNATPTNE